MNYHITYESSFARTLTGQRVPTTETRATMESARKRVLDMAEKMGMHQYDEILLGTDPYLDFGPTFGAHIEKD